MRDLTFAVHHKGHFADRWIEQCRKLNVSVEIINGLGNEVIQRLRHCDALLWHLNQDLTEDLAFGRSVLLAANTMGLRTFPSLATSWHFDDKVAQKFLLEAIGAPLARTWVFFSKEEALSWAKSESFPKVFKLRRGAGSTNVRLVQSKAEADRLIRVMFSRGLTPVTSVNTQVRGLMSKGKGLRSVLPLIKKIPGYLAKHVNSKQGFGTERGYVLFQEFVAGNEYDIRVTVIGARAFFFNRRVRDGDFRASGSGRLEYCEIDEEILEAVRLAFGISESLSFQCMAYDFVKDKEADSLRLLEVSYVFNAEAIHACRGYLDRDLGWHDGNFWPQELIVQDLVNDLTTAHAAAGEQSVVDQTEVKTHLTTA